MRSHTDENEQSTVYQYAIGKFEEAELKSLEKAGEKPIIVALFDENDGAENATYAIEHFENDGCKVYPVSPERGLAYLNSPEFRELEYINGILLPGGSDIPTQASHDARKEFEEKLIDLAEKNDIPLLGICRGQQIIGYQNGLNLRSFSDDAVGTHYGHANKIRQATHNFTINNDISVYKGSQLFNALSAKIFGKPNENKYDYNVACMHHQRLTPSLLENPKVKITAIDQDDNSIEGIQMSTGKYMTVGYQHHPEAIATPARQQRAEKLESIREEKDNADMFHYQDPDMVLLSAYKAKQKADVAKEKSVEEKIANVELELFTDQVKHKFIGQRYGDSIPKANPPTFTHRFFQLFTKQSPHGLKQEARKLMQNK